MCALRKPLGDIGRTEMYALLFIISEARYVVSLQT